MCDPAHPAPPRRLVSRIELREYLGQIVDNARQLALGAMDQRSAPAAEPFESVTGSRGPGALDDEADAAFLRTLRRVADMRRQQKHRTLGEGHPFESASIRDEQFRIPLQLVEELLDRIVVEIAALVGASDDSHDEIGVRPKLLIAHRRPDGRAM